MANLINIYGKINNAVNTVSSVSSTINSAATSLNSVTGINPTTAVNALGSITEAAKQSASGTLINSATSAVSTLASGLSNLPGGAGAAGALVNNATNQLTGAADKLGAAAGTLGGATAGLTGLANDIKDKATSALNNLKPPSLDPAAALAKSGLPSGLASKLAAQISAISSGGGVPISMPTIAINTTNRGEITSQINALLGEAGIPKPNLLGEVQQSTKDSYENLIKQENEKAKACEELKKAYQKANDAKYKMSDKIGKARKKLPQGSPELEALETEYSKIYKQDGDAYAAWAKCRKDNGLD